MPDYNAYNALNEVRIDKWLWAARCFKTRSTATTACQAGKVKLNGRAVKASHGVRSGDRIAITRTAYRQELLVTELQEKRVSAQLAAHMYEDHTRPEELEQLRLRRTQDSAFFQRQRGSGRPTKRQRRRLDKLTGKF